MEKERGIKITKAYDEGKSDGIISNIIICCPNCGSENSKDESTYKPIKMRYGGPPVKRNKLKDLRSCNDCGILFKPIKGNGL